MRPSPILRPIGVVFVALVLASVGAAGTISGTSRGDILRGTPHADTIYGRQGDDTLVGRSGNDLLVPGPGADVVRCGPGRDTVRADVADTVAKDCEVVQRVTPFATPGSYVGRSSQNEQVTFDVLTGGTQVAHFRVNSVNQSCAPENEIATFGPLDYAAATFVVSRSGSFAVSYAGPGTVRGYAATFAIRTSGRFAGSGATGTIRFDATFADDAGTTFACSSGDVTWTASRR